MLDFLKQVKATAPETTIRRASGVRKERNPMNADLRVFVDGSIYPSAALVAKFKLEYGNKPEEGQDPVGNGFDIIDSNEFQQYLPVPVRCIWISPVSRSEMKVDLFGTVTYDKETGAPKASVLDQGTVTFGQNVLIPLIEAAYGITIEETEAGKTFSNGQKHIDLKMYSSDGQDNTENPFFLPAGRTMAFIPKSKQRGEEKGTPTVIKRDNPEFYCLYPAAVQEMGADVEETEEVPAEPVATAAKA
jgi:hypothetical protein